MAEFVSSRAQLGLPEDYDRNNRPRLPDYGGFVPFGELKALDPKPSERFGDAITHVLSTIGADNYVAGRMGRSLRDLSLLSPLGVPLGLADLKHAMDKGTVADVMFNAPAIVPGGRGTVLTLADMARQFKGSASFRPGVLSSGDASLIKRDWAAASPIKSIEDHYIHAPENQADLADYAKRIADELGIAWKDPGIKNIERVREKVDLNGKAPSRINDVVRGGFVVKTPEQAEEIAKRFGERYQIADELWHATPEGYIDRKLLTRFPNGQVGEVQLWNEPFAKYKDQGTALYTEARTLPNDDPRKLQLDAQARALYEQALAESAPEWRSVFGR